MKYNRCRVCNTIDQTKRWSSKTLCHCCYQKEYVLNNKLNRYCIKCNSSESKGSWYRGPTCSKCYHNNRYKHSRAKTIGQKYCHILSQSKRKHSLCDITKEEYITLINKGCYYCGRNLLELTGTSLDKVYPDKGYIISNVLPCCGDCNTIKMNILTVEETTEVIKLLKELRNTQESPWLKNKDKKE